MTDPARFIGPAIRAAPEWIHRWRRARQGKDFRVLPEQAEGIQSLHFHNGYPLGEVKAIGHPSGYEDVYLIVETKPHDDPAFFVQPEEYSLP